VADKADKVRIKMRYGAAAILTETDAAIAVAPADPGNHIVTIVGERADLLECITMLVEALHEHGLGEELEEAVRTARETKTL
jgi:hypothetical protein